jgi:uncharacterized protein YbjT (DUF2867 family)
MSASSRIAVAGATGRVGRHVVEVLRERGCDVVAMSRASGVDVVTGSGLAQALEGVERIIDVASGPSPEQRAATEFFETATANLQRESSRAGVSGIVVVSIIGTEHFTTGYNAAKVAHEQAMLSGPIPVRVLRAAQFHEFVPQLVEWGTRGDVAYVQRMRTQLVAARTVAEQLVELALAPGAEFSAGGGDAEPSQIAGPRDESLTEMAKLLVGRRGQSLRIEEWRDPDDPDRELLENGALLPGPDAILAGPTFEEWLEADAQATQSHRDSGVAYST